MVDLQELVVARAKLVVDLVVVVSIGGGPLVDEIQVEGRLAPLHVLVGDLLLVHKVCACAVEGQIIPRWIAG